MINALGQLEVQTSPMVPVPQDEHARLLHDRAFLARLMTFCLHDIADDGVGHYVYRFDGKLVMHPDTWAAIVEHLCE